MLVVCRWTPSYVCWSLPSNPMSIWWLHWVQYTQSIERSHTNLNADTLKSHAGSLKHFLLWPWMKKQWWATIRTATEDLDEAMESYALELFVQKHCEIRLEVASDDLAFTIIHAKNDHPILLNGIVGELQKRGNYEPVFVRDFAPTDRRKRYTYIKQLEKGLPMRCIMVTKTFGSSIGNYHYVWKIPPNVSFENALTQNQQVVRVISDELPKYHTRCMRREFMSKFGLISPSSVLRYLQGIACWAYCI